MLKRQVIKNVFSYFSCMFAILKENKYGLGCKINARRWINKKSEETCKQSKTSCKWRFVGCKFTGSGFVCVISTLSVRTLVGNFQHRKKKQCFITYSWWASTPKRVTSVECRVVNGPKKLNPTGPYPIF